MKNKIKDALEAAGIYFRFTKNLPVGMDWMRDVSRKINLGSPPVFFDVGANIGQTSRAFLGHFPNSTIHAFEPVSSTFSQLKQTCSHLKNISTHNYALGSTKGVAVIANTGNSLTNSLLRGPEPNQNVATESVQISTIDEFCETNSVDRIDILKSDTEGYDLHVLKGADRMLNERRISCLVCESTLDPNDRVHSPFLSMHDFLRGKGYECVAFYGLNNMFRTHRYGSYFDALFIDKSRMKG